ncbi:MAG: ArnT family glycosyltransferase [Saprospiraceae bacterium]
MLLPLGSVHLFDWDEINFAEAAREMVVTGDYLRVSIDFQPFYEKPPLFLWLQATAMNIFGVGEYAARLPNAIAGILTLLFIFKIGRRLYDAQFGRWWMLVYVGSILPQLYFHSGIIDPWFNLFTFAALYYFLLYHWRVEGWKGTKTFKGPYYFFILSAFFLGLAILTKGPVAFLLVSLCFAVYFVIRKGYFFISIPKYISYTILVLLLPALWFGAEYLSNGSGFISEFIQYQIRLLSTKDAGHGGFLGYHFIVLFIGCFPASIFALRSFFKTEQELKIQKSLRLWMKILFWVVVIVFSIVQSKIVHYSSLAYFPITYLAALRIYQVTQNKARFAIYEKSLLLTLGIVLSIIVIAVPFLGQQPYMLMLAIQNDPFALANLQAEVVWESWRIIGGVILLLGILLGFYFLQKQRNTLGIRLLFASSAFFVITTLYLFINNIEGYSQRAAIDFYKTLPENALVVPYGYKSYAHLFYTNKTAEQAALTGDKGKLLQKETHFNQPVYVITKNTKTERFEQEYPHFEYAGEKNGFVFYKKE